MISQSRLQLIGGYKPHSDEHVEFTFRLRLIAVMNESRQLGIDYSLDISNKHSENGDSKCNNKAVIACLLLPSEEGIQSPQ